MQYPQQLDQFIRKPEVKRITGMSESTIRRLELAGKFPRRRRTSVNTVAYLKSEVMEWMKTRQVAGF